MTDAPEPMPYASSVRILAEPRSVCEPLFTTVPLSTRRTAWPPEMRALGPMPLV